MRITLRVLSVLAVIIFVVSGCKKFNNPTSPPAQPTVIIGTATVSPTISATFTITLTSTITQTGTTTPTTTPTFTATQTITPLYQSFQRGVSPDASYNGVSDAELWQNTADSNYGGCDAYGAGAFPYATPVIIRSLVKYDVSSIGTGVYVVKSTLTVQKSYCLGTVNPLFYPLNDDFVEGTGCNTILPGTATWNSRGPALWTTPGGDGDYQLTPASGPLSINCGFNSYTFSMDNSVVGGWINSPAGNHGVILIAGDEVTGNNVFRISSSENTTPGNRPLLEIYYYRP